MAHRVFLIFYIISFTLTAYPQKSAFGLQGPWARAQRSGLVKATIPRVAPKKGKNFFKKESFVQQESVFFKNDFSTRTVFSKKCVLSERDAFSKNVFFQTESCKKKALFNRMSFFKREGFFPRTSAPLNRDFLFHGEADS